MLALLASLFLCLLAGGCATGMHSAPAPDDADVIPITEQLVDAQQQQSEQPSAASPDLGGLPASGPGAPTPHFPTSGGPGPGVHVYKLGAGDVLSITVWDHPELTGAPAREQGVDGAAAGLGPPAASFVIDQQGRLRFPFAGTMRLAGLTREQAGDLLTRRLARYFREPRVTLGVQAYRSQRVYIDGEVRTPGAQAINDIPMTLLEALNRAGGMLPGADQSRIVVERAGKRHSIDLVRALRGGGNLGAAAVMLADGDIVRVPPRDESKVFVAGEVLQPRALTMHDGRLTLSEALGEVGGINPQSGDAGKVYVVRRTAQGPRVYRLDARPSRAMALAERFELRPKDVVYVAASPLANWHRAISQLFPGELSSAVGAGRP
ncbi:MAG TPA: polysaccharide biosynthesis/export family protein [Duganella sp.]